MLIELKGKDVQMVVHVVRWLTEEWPNLCDRFPHNAGFSSGMKAMKRATYLGLVTTSNCVKAWDDLKPVSRHMK